MEQKKLLWVVVTVGAFLMIVIGTALILYAPSKNSDPAIASISPQTNGRGIQPDPDAWVRNPETAPPFSAAENDPRQISELTVVSGNTTVVSDRTTFDITGLGLSDMPPTAVTVQNAGTEPAAQDGQIRASPGEPIQPPPPATQQVAATAQQPPVQYSAPQSPAAQTAPVAAAPVTARPAAVQPSASNPAVTASAAKPAAAVRQPTAAPQTPRSTAAAPIPAQKQITEYWIQAGAFSEKMRAEQVRQNLSVSKITAEVFTKDVKGQLFYRVRTGPYKTKTEAEYWLGVVQNTADFGDSYISEVQALR